MLKRVQRSFAAFQSPFESEWGKGGQGHSGRKVIVSQSFYRDDLLLSLSPLKARFSQRESYVSLKSRGTMIVDYIRREQSPTDATRKNLMFREKKSFSILPENFYDFIHIGSKGLQVARNTETEQKSLKITKKDDTWVWAIEIYNSDSTSYKAEISLKQWEMFTAQKLFEYSLPYIYGWNGLDGDNSIEYMSPGSDVDPFDKQ
mmetsp:Transcript_7370/g.13698  ORF Transcript_7370/g.13698 Transcript_7370/m.13698 type:complete len:203 (+) Transcript_7370:24-632(+)